MKLTAENIEMIRKYWLFLGLEEIYPYSQANNEDKQSIANTYGFQTYILGFRINELGKDIYKSLPKFIRKILRLF